MYVPSEDRWVSAGNTPTNMIGPGSEFGPGLLLQNGRAFFVGGNGTTAYYTSGPTVNVPGSWQAGPNLPNGLIADDAPGTVMPNGHVLLEGEVHQYGGPSTYFDFDPTTNTYTTLTAPYGGVSGGTTYVDRMLVLPTGQVLFDDEYVYTPGSGPSAAWQPTIASVSANSDGSYHLTGTLLNGASFGAGYGDDATMASNYPLVQLADGSGHVSYATTFNWAPGTVGNLGGWGEATDFTLPSGVTSGTYSLRVIGDGIASNPISFTVGAANDLTVVTPQALIVGENGSGTGNVLTGALDSDAETITAVAGTFATGHGSVTIASNGSYTYTPSSGFFGRDSISFTAQTLDDTAIGIVNVTVTAPPAAPTNLSPVPGNTQVTLSWTASPGATSYDIYRGTSSGGESLIQSGVTATSFTNTGLTNGTVYYYKVSAVNAAGQGLLSTEVSAEPGSGIFVKTDSTTQGNWSGTYGSDGYDVSQDATTSIPSYAQVTINGQANYTWAASTTDVRALEKPENLSDRLAACWCSGGTFTINVNLTDGQTHQVALYALDWDSYGPRQEQIQVINAATGTVLDARTVSSFNGGQYLVWNVSGNVEFQITNLVGNSNAVISGLFFGSANSTGPATPTGLTATPGSGQVTLSWNASSGATSYNLYRGTTSGGETLWQSGITGTSFTDTGLTNGTTYYYEVTAVNSSESSKSSEVSATPANQPPAITTPASALPATVIGKTTNLSVQASDPDGDALTYTWAVTSGPSGVSFSANGTGSANNATATFTQAGSYTFQVTVQDTAGLTATSSVTVSVNQTLTSLAVVPSTTSLNDGGTQQFTVSAKDQFGSAMAVTPTWSVSSGPGSISTTGLYTAPVNGSFAATVQAASGTLTASAAVTITNQAPTVTAAASATPNPVTGTTTGLSALGADDGGEANLTYTWSATGPAAVTFSANGTNAAKNTTATFTKAGTYTFQVTLTDLGGLTATSSVSVTVNQTLTSLTVSPNSITVADGATQQFTASGKDQFGNAMSVTPTWSVSGLGTISSSGLYTAPSTGSGSATVTATSGSLSASAGVTVTATTTGNIAIDAGGGAAGSFLADADFSGGSPYSTGAAINTSGVTNPAPQSVYQTERYGNFTYTVPNLTPGASYTVRLDFAEIYWNSAGQRVFNVTINGTQVLSNFDIFATAGGQNIAIAEQFGTTANSSGQVVIQFTTIKDNAKVSGIEITAGTVSAPPAPTGLTATPGNGQVALTWNAASGAASYNLYRGTSSGGETLVASGLTATSYTDTGRTNGDNYFYTVTAVNSAGASGFSNEATAWPQAPGGIIWVEDSTPIGAAQAADGGDAWTWSGSGPAPYSGSQDQQSTAASGEHQHYFYNASQTMTVQTGDTLYAHVYLNPANPPSEVMLQWNVAGSWEHRAYWGANDIGWGTDGTVSRQHIGALPATGGWVHLAVPASAVGLGGTTVSGMAFTLYGGQADWDQAGVASAPAEPTGLTATAGNGQVALNWTASSGASSYNLYRSTSSGTEQLVAAGITGTSYTNTGLTNGSTYYYEVTAVNGNGESTCPTKFPPRRKPPLPVRPPSSRTTPAPKAPGVPLMAPMATTSTSTAPACRAMPPSISRATPTTPGTARPPMAAPCRNPAPAAALPPAGTPAAASPSMST